MMRFLRQGAASTPVDENPAENEDGRGIGRAVKKVQ